MIWSMSAPPPVLTSIPRPLLWSDSVIRLPSRFCMLLISLSAPGTNLRAELRTPVPERESIAELARHGATMAFYLSVHLIGDVVKELLKGGVYTEKTPAAVVYRATWEDEKIIKGTLGDIAKKTKDAKIIKTALIIVGDVIAPAKYEYSKVYDAGFTHGYRKGVKEEKRG